jgi:predicted nucleic acid-binding Zn ribbon protein
LLRATADERLPALTCEEIHHWLSHLTLEDITQAHDSLFVLKASAEMPNLPDPPTAILPPQQACAGCGTTLPSSAKFCSECGRTVAGNRRCINCNASLQEDAHFCSSCGFRV